ncbi:glycoside hydrolase family 13 protein [Actinacidiphila bryophytorum]|uniref:Alpha-glucosidase n=1 Tax=Actinacidiphila bryophytorum TaxID=1436133 RepID=A0A9W4E541_9ACTN|nr:glycoside hydrolase family 13 protein [Actinacidiphila bryophytorum]MBM9434840.1 glycoside hydrolase family 13 protein [Actinacidiphila bryophytorum]MBN6545089.1 glycoside hydrolase family 13 protein [Actinacidiphila bryophytorum]CAG7630716.1 Alpha-glucosidase [Actinacidiphila bryophytorum]
MADTPQPEADENWWRGAVIYQVYPRSFADSNGDGTGDLAGVRSRLPYLAELGVNALWFCPWYPSPMADGGYDVADYRDVEPVFGTLAEAEKLISEALVLGIRTIIDIVPNHISAAHPWFREALAAGRGSAARERFWFRPGRGEHGELPPNNWPSQFGGPAWTRTTEPDGTPGDWFLNLFDSEQPDLNWNHPDVRAEHEDILRFWFDRGAGGVRIDSAAMVSKDPQLPDLPDPAAGADAVLAAHPYVDRDELHDIYRGWRRIADSYPGARILVGEVWLPDAERFARYLRPDEMHTAFNFDFLACPWEPARLRTSIDTTLAAHAPVSAPATWVLCNHDVTRTVTRYGRADTGFDFATKAFGIPTDLELGTRRARAAALLTLALPGSVYLYQGEELGLPEAEDIPLDKLQDPMYLRSAGTNPGRDGCRVPLPWSGTASPFGFSPAGAGAQPWLPQPADWASRTAEAQGADPDSMLSLYRAALRLRRAEAGLGDGSFGWLDSDPQVLAFRRSPEFLCVLNLGAEPAELPEHTEVLLASGPLADGRLPADTAVWLRG